jgi:hypothetical protein
MSMTRSALSVVKTWMPPSWPAGTTAELLMIPPVCALRTTVPGNGWPVAHAEMYPTAWPTGVMEVKFKEYAAEAGTPQVD